MYKWTDFFRSLRSIWSSPCLPRIFFWKGCKSDAFDIHNIRKYIYPLRSCPSCEISISVSDIWSRTVPIKMTDPGINISIKSFIARQSQGTTMVQTDIYPSEFEYLNISYTSTPGISSAQNALCS